MRYWNRTVTVYSKSKDGNGKTIYRKTVVKNCFWGRETIKNLVNGNYETASQTICRFPKIVVKYGQVKYGQVKYGGNLLTVNTGDCIFLGELTEEMKDVSGFRPSDFLKKHIGFSVKNVADNCGASPPHYKAGGTSG